MTLLTADTKVTDPVLWRFAYDTSRRLGAPLTMVAEGRTPCEVLRDVRFLGNGRITPCRELRPGRGLRSRLRRTAVGGDGKCHGPTGGLDDDAASRPNLLLCVGEEALRRTGRGAGGGFAPSVRDMGEGFVCAPAVTALQGEPCDTPHCPASPPWPRSWSTV
jgi:hypothetical protein